MGRMGAEFLWFVCQQAEKTFREVKEVISVWFNKLTGILPDKISILDNVFTILVFVGVTER